VASIEGGAAQFDGEHGFADTRGSDEQHVGSVGQIRAGCELSDEFLVDAGLGGEVEVFELVGGWEVREPNPAVPPASFGGFDLDPK